MKNGFFQLSTNNLYWYNAMAKKLPKQLPPPVRELIDHLRTTGTGETKLQAIAEVALATNDGKEFLLAVKEVVPELTFEKIQDYVDSRHKNSAETIVTAEELEEVTTSPSEKTEDEKAAETLPTKGMNAADAVAKIKNGDFGADQLEVIIGFDTRESVVKAAAKKLEEIVTS